MSEKTLDVKDIHDASTKVSDIQVIGNGDMFQLLCKASSKSQGWMKSTKAMEIPGAGCIVQVTTQQGDNVAEALTFVPWTTVVPDTNGGRRIVTGFNADGSCNDILPLSTEKATCEKRPHYEGGR